MNNVALWYHPDHENDAREISDYVNSFAFNSWLLPFPSDRMDSRWIMDFYTCNFMIVLLSKGAEDLVTNDFQIIEKHFPKIWQIIIPCRIEECEIPQVLNQYHIVEYVDSRSDLIQALNDNCSEKVELGGLFDAFSTVFYDLNKKLDEDSVNVPAEIMDHDLKTMLDFLERAHNDSFHLICGYHIKDLNKYHSQVSQNPYFMDHALWCRKELAVYCCRLISVQLNLVLGDVLSLKNRVGIAGAQASTRYARIISYGNMIFDSISGILPYFEQGSDHWTFCKKTLVYVNGCFRAIFNHMSELDTKERILFKDNVAQLSKRVVELVTNI